jgi:hypothetical protein
MDTETYYNIALDMLQHDVEVDKQALFSPMAVCFMPLIRTHNWLLSPMMWLRAVMGRLYHRYSYS